MWNHTEPQTINLKPGQACLFQNIWHRGEANPTTSETSYGVHFYVVPRAIAVEIRSGKLSLDQTQGLTSSRSTSSSAVLGVSATRDMMRPESMVCTGGQEKCRCQ